MWPKGSIEALKPSVIRLNTIRHVKCGLKGVVSVTTKTSVFFCVEVRHACQIVVLRTDVSPQSRVCGKVDVCFFSVIQFLAGACGLRTDNETSLVSCSGVKILKSRSLKHCGVCCMCDGVRLGGTAVVRCWATFG